MTRRKNATSYYIVTYDSQQFQMCIGKNIIATFYELSMPQRVVPNMTQIYISARQSENTPLSTGNNEKVSCLGLQVSVYEFTTENGAKMTIFEFLLFIYLYFSLSALYIHDLFAYHPQPYPLTCHLGFLLAVDQLTCTITTYL